MKKNRDAVWWFRRRRKSAEDQRDATERSVATGKLLYRGPLKRLHA